MQMLSMTLLDVIQLLKETTKKHKLLNSAISGASLYTINHLTIRDYAMLFIQPSYTDDYDDNIMTYRLNLYYIDRLLNDSSNELEIYSAGNSFFTDFLNELKRIDGIFNVRYDSRRNLFTETERLSDRCSGVWVTLYLQVLKESVCSTIDEEIPYDMFRRDDFFYDIYYDKIDYAAAKEYFDGKEDIELGFCSALRKGNTIGRNYDWYYDNEVNFMVKTPDTIGIASGMKALNKDSVASRKNLYEYKILPFMVSTAMNKDLYIEVNVVPYSGYKSIIPTEETKEKISSLMLCRYVADRFHSVQEAVEYLNGYVEIYTPKSLVDMGYELHWMIADKESNLVIENHEGELVTIDTPISTNFHLYGTTTDEDGLYFTNVTAKYGDLPTSQGIDRYGTGIERYNALKTHLEGAESIENIMVDTFYSKAYTLPVNEDFWYSEFVGTGATDIDVDTPYDNAQFVERIDRFKDKFDNRSRENPEVWHTAYSVITDLDNLTMRVSSQEGTYEYEYVMTAL